MENKRIIISLGVLVVALLTAVIVLAAVLGVQNSKNSDSTQAPQQDKRCMTKACIAAANNILQNMNRSADPCEDFSDFACGTFNKNQRIPDDQNKIDVFDVLRTNLAYQMSELLAEAINSKDIEATENAKKLYHSCLNESIVEEVGEANFKNFITTTFGPWPALDEKYDPSEFNPLKTLTTFRVYGFRQLLDLRIETNPKNSSQYILKVKQPSWFFNRDYYQSPNFANVIEAYKAYAVTILAYLSGKSKDNAYIKNQVDRMYDMEKELGILIIPDAEKRNATYKNMTIDSLSKELPEFEWEDYIINGIFKEHVKTIDITKDEIVLVDDWNYLKSALKLYQNYKSDPQKKQDFKNLLIWAFSKDRTGLLPKKYKDAKLEFDKIYRGTNSIQARSITCANLVLDRMEYAGGRLYVAKYFDENSKKAASEMINYIQNEFKNIVRRNAWMDESSKQKAIEKADRIDKKIGYPDFVYNETYMNDYYKDYQFNASDYLKNTITIYKVDSIDDFKELRSFRNKSNWISGPAVVNAFYSASSNQICFPAGILQPPFYDSQFPNYLNYGGIGSVIGHEITHGFDDRGRLYDKDGTYFADGDIGLWTEQTIQNYKQKAVCIVNQYTSFLAKQVNKTLNGAQTQGENIADNGGIKESFYGYQQWVKENGPEPLLPGLEYNQNQLFFINYAQVWCAKWRDQALISRILTGVHSPGEFRIRGPTSNFDEFAKAFNCKKDTGNNPEQRCTVW